MKSCARCGLQLHEDATVCAHCHSAQPPQWFEVTGIRLSMQCYAQIRTTALPNKREVCRLIEALRLQVESGAYDEPQTGGAENG